MGIGEITDKDLLKGMINKQFLRRNQTDDEQNNKGIRKIGIELVVMGFSQKSSHIFIEKR